MYQCLGMVASSSAVSKIVEGEGKVPVGTRVVCCRFRMTSNLIASKSEVHTVRTTEWCVNPPNNVSCLRCYFCGRRNAEHMTSLPRPKTGARRS